MSTSNREFNSNVESMLIHGSFIIRSVVISIIFKKIFKNQKCMHYALGESTIQTCHWMHATFTWYYINIGVGIDIHFVILGRIAKSTTQNKYFN